MGGGGHWFLYNLLNVPRSVKSKLLLVSLPLYSEDVSLCLYINKYIFINVDEFKTRYIFNKVQVVTEYI